MRFLYFLPILLAVNLAAQAQTQTGIATGTSTLGAATPYQVQYDSLQARASRVRADVAARTRSIEASFLAVGGTRRAINSFGTPRMVPLSGGEALLHNIRVKREVVKHKMHGARVQKVLYYAPALRLYEYYEDGQLVQQELYSYPLGTAATGLTFVTMRWLRGNYLTVSERSGNAGSSKAEIFTQPISGAY